MNAITIEHDQETMNQIGPSPSTIRLQFSHVSDVLPGLEAAVQSLIGAANRDRRCGILIVRHGPGDYTATLDPSVKFGETETRILA
ncbi:hypothetical protein [Arthrobacter sp. CJ23]|uniref:hypothetical protein n=1 Tax=Arthrobacter sp. CJ23 TaxID=2972479 RepID=UPI00215D5777|nr:hypothetical protein [Arthrobacter sp. CJ23]UVJ41313.1 hypothetical protein NVV90_09295 [Arthrobacter sp. CJ23]